MTHFARSDRLGVCLLVLLYAVSFARPRAQAPQTGSAPPERGPATGLILGQVVDAGSGRAVGGAIVSISGAANLPLPAMTDGDGRFLFPSLAAGNYTLSVAANGYVPGMFGRLRVDGPGRPLELGQNERVTDAQIRIWKYASIAGTVVDDAGEPLVGVEVRALRRLNSAERRRFQAGEMARTDDRGAYRIPSLVPGEYIVSFPNYTTSFPTAAVEEYLAAVGAGSTTRLTQQRLETGASVPVAGVRVGDMHVVTGPRGNATPVLVRGKLMVFPTTFYPSATAPSQATLLRLASGEARTGVDVQLRALPSVRVSGMLMSQEGLAASVGVRLTPNNDASSDSLIDASVTTTDATGRFTFLGVTPGQYLARAYRQPRNQSETVAENVQSIGGTVVTSGTVTFGGAAPRAPIYFAEQMVNVGDTDVDGVQLTLRQGAEVSGTIVFDGAAAKPTPQRMAQLQVSLIAIDIRLVSNPGFQRVESDGTFKTSGYPPGRYRLSLGSPGAPWVITSVTAGGADILRTPLELGTTPIADVVVTFGDRPSEISGTVQGDPKLVEGAQVVAFPAEYQEWIARGAPPAQQVTTFADKKGSYRLRPILPGDYLVAAFDAPITLEADAPLLSSLARTATRVTVTPGDVRTIALPLGKLR